MTQVWRLHIKPDAKTGVDAASLCITQGILGIGWQVEIADSNRDWDSYYQLAKAKYYGPHDKRWWPALNALKNHMKLDDLCWTRDTRNVYYLGRVSSEWRYETEREYKDADVVNVRDCSWAKVGTVESVPGTVVNAFNWSRTLQRVGGNTIIAFSQYKHNLLAEDYTYEVLPVEADVFSLLSSEDCEDIVALLLQSKGYYLIASSCKRQTGAYEYVLKHKTNGNVAVAQVKSGTEDLDMDAYSSFEGEVYLFTSRGSHVGTPTANVHCIKREELEQFMERNDLILPGKVQTWIKLAEELSSGTKVKT